MIMSKDVMSKVVREYLRKIGQRGGEARGRTKRRGDATYYKALALRRWRSGKPREEGPG
jgi:hypothetical protein